jgi:hypothetical protein
MYDGMSFSERLIFAKNRYKRRGNEIKYIFGENGYIKLGTEGAKWIPIKLNDMSNMMGCGGRANVY